MDEINKIIREEIERYILHEVIDFSGLNGYANQLNRSIGNLRSINTSTFNDDLKTFFNNLSTYGIQVIAAINRCTNAQNLNEAYWGGLSNYGINLPGELGGNMVSDFIQGYNWRKNLASRNGKTNAYGNANGRTNNNSVPSVKLQVLLTQLPQWQQAYANKNSQYGIDNFTQEPYNILSRIMPSIQQEYQTQIQNAQGNP